MHECMCLSNRRGSSNCIDIVPGYFLQKEQKSIKSMPSNHIISLALSFLSFIIYVNKHTHTHTQHNHFILFRVETK